MPDHEEKNQSKAGNAKAGKSKGRNFKKREDIALMKDLMTKARDGDSFIFEQKKSKRLEFSNQSLCVYDRHKITINDIFLNTNINTFVSFNDKQLHSWSPETMDLITSVNFMDSEQPKQKQISQIQALCYSKKYHLYMACTKDFQFIIFNEHLNVVHTQRMPVGLVTQIKFLDKTDQLFVGGKEGCFIIDLSIQFKYDAGMAILLDPKGFSITIKIKEITPEEREEISDFDPLKIDKVDKLPVNYLPEKYGKHVKQLQGISEWVKGMKIFENQGLLVVWKKEIGNQNIPGLGPEEPNKNLKIKASDDQIIFYNLVNDKQYEQGEIWSKYFDYQIQEDYITDILVFKDQKFFVTAHNMGDIHLRKLQDLKTYLEEQKRKNQKNSPNQKIEIAPGANHSEGTKSIHVFKGHSRRVTSLMPIKEKGTYFVSASLDGKVRIWCIEKMIELYCFDISIDSPVTNSAIDSTIQNVILINDSIYAMIFHQNIEIGLISHLASSYFISKQNICSLVKCYQSSFCRRINKPKILSVQFSDNSLVLLDPSNQKVFSTIYPPPTQAEISKVFWCSSIQRMFLLLKSGSLCIYQTQKETGILEKLQESTAFKDYESKPLAQGITCVSLCHVKPPKYDCEILSDLHKYKEPKTPGFQIFGSKEEIESGTMDTFLVIGLNKGTIIFVKVDNLEAIYARFSIHRQAICHIHELKEAKVFISICEEMNMNIFGFENGREKVYQNFNIFRQVFQIITAQENQLMMCFESGDTEMLLWDEQTKNLLKLKSDKSDEHENKLTCGDVLTAKGLIITGDQSGLIKIWNFKKQLIREIQFVESINSVAFLNEKGDIVVGHSGNLSLVHYVDFIDESLILSEEQQNEILTQFKPAKTKWFKKLWMNHQMNLKKGNKASLKTEHLETEIIFEKTQESVKKEPTEKLQKEIPAPEVEGRLSTKNLELVIKSNDHQYHPPTKRPMISQQTKHMTTAIIQTRSELASISSKKLSQQLKLSSGTASNTHSIMKPDKRPITQIRNECIKIPSVPKTFIQMRKKMNEQERLAKLMSGNTRRMMTNFRISDNIVKFNDPIGPNIFNDILISCSAIQKPFDFTQLQEEIHNDILEDKVLIKQANVLPGVMTMSRKIHEPDRRHSGLQDGVKTFSMVENSQKDYQLQTTEKKLEITNAEDITRVVRRPQTQSSEDKGSLHNIKTIQNHRDLGMSGFNGFDDQSMQTHHAIENVMHQDSSTFRQNMGESFVQKQQPIYQESALTPTNLEEPDFSPNETKHLDEKEFIDPAIQIIQMAALESLEQQQLIGENTIQQFQQNSDDLRPRMDTKLNNDPTTKNLKSNASNEKSKNEMHIQSHQGSIAVKDMATSNMQSPKNVMLHHLQPHNSISMKMFSNQIRGSQRSQNPNEFLSTRIQQKVSGMQHIPPHVITNANLKTNQHYMTQTNFAKYGTERPIQRANMRRSYNPEGKRLNTKLSPEQTMQDNKIKQRVKSSHNTQRYQGGLYQAGPQALQNNNFISQRTRRVVSGIQNDELGLLAESSLKIRNNSKFESRQRSSDDGDREKEIDTNYSVAPKVQDLLFGEMILKNNRAGPNSKSLRHGRLQQMKNNLVQGGHMPSKGMFNIHRNMKNQKPMTAGHGQRGRNETGFNNEIMHPMSGSRRQVDFAGFQSSFYNSSNPNNRGQSASSQYRQPSAYRGKMARITEFNSLNYATAGLEQQLAQMSGTQNFGIDQLNMLQTPETAAILNGIQNLQKTLSTPQTLEPPIPLKKNWKSIGHNSVKPHNLVVHPGEHHRSSLNDTMQSQPKITKIQANIDVKVAR